MNNELELVTLTTANDPNFAEILKIALAEEGINCVIEGEHQAGMTGIFTIRVLVAQQDLERAREIRDRHAESDDAESDDADSDDADSDDADSDENENGDSDQD